VRLERYNNSDALTSDDSAIDFFPGLH
jgi:hypothetical protein